MLWNLKAIENGALPVFVALLIVILPGYTFIYIRLISRILALVAAILLLAPVYSANSWMHGDVSYSWKTWIWGEHFKCSTEDLICKANDGTDLNSIICIPEKPIQQSPCILILHGGGFTTGSAMHGLELAKTLASEGYYCVTIDYRLAPQTTFPGQLNDIDQVWSRFKKLNHGHTVDTNSLFILGESAGASIALNYAQFTENHALKGVVNLYGITDFIVAGESLKDDLSSLSEMINAYRGVNSPTSISPSNPELQTELPILTIHGAKDAAVSETQAIQFHEFRIKNKLPSTLHILPWAAHLFNHPSSGPSGQVSKQLILDFIHLNSGLL